MRRQTPLRRKSQRVRKAVADAMEHGAWRELALERADGLCERCDYEPPSGRWAPERAVEVHHILPRGRGGKNWEFNGAALCSSCHRGVHEHRPGFEGYLARTEGEARQIREHLDLRNERLGTG